MGRTGWLRRPRCGRKQHLALGVMLLISLAFDESSALPVWLERDGYETALAGKYLNDYSLDGHDEVPPSWNDWQAMDSVPLEKYSGYTVNENSRIVRHGDKPADVEPPHHALT